MLNILYVDNKSSYEYPPSYGKPTNPQLLDWAVFAAPIILHILLKIEILDDVALTSQHHYVAPLEHNLLIVMKLIVSFSPSEKIVVNFSRPLPTGLPTPSRFEKGPRRGLLFFCLTS